MIERQAIFTQGVVAGVMLALIIGGMLTCILQSGIAWRRRRFQDGDQGAGGSIVRAKFPE